MQAMKQPSTSKPARVLVVDDEPLIRRVLSRLLTSLGYDVIVADGDAATRAVIEKGGYDLVITDLNMPDIDGLSVLRLVRAKDPELPVILMTAAPSAETAIGAVQLRATAYLTKPIDAARFGEEVQQALALSALSRVRKEAHALLSARDTDADVELTAQFDRALTGVFMVYQPIVSWSSRSVFGFEALVRSSEPSLPHPGALFGASEKLGRSIDLGRVIRQRSIEPILKNGSHLFLNLHAEELLDEHLFAPDSSLAKMAERVVLEITERAQLESVPDFEKRILALRAMGFRIAIDDIGAGYSGLTSFVLLKPEMVKLDMALVRDIDKDPVKRRLARVVIELCRDLGIAVIGEGIETVAERDALVDLGCDLLQGYLLSRPGAAFPVPNYGEQ